MFISFIYVWSYLSVIIGEIQGNYYSIVILLSLYINFIVKMIIFYTPFFCINVLLQTFWSKLLFM